MQVYKKLVTFSWLSFLLGVWAYSAGEVDDWAGNLYTIAEEDTCRSAAQH
jgi:hypothetical protein